MSSPIPVPRIPSSDRRRRDDFNNNSALSLPRSIRSSVTAFSDNHYEVGTVDVFSPRPTIRYSLHAQAVSGALRSTVASRTESRWEGEGSPRQMLKESKTIDDLADRYDAMTVREIMERDQKRREKKRRTEEDRAKRRLERHAAREKGEGGHESKSKAKSKRRARSPRTEMAEHRKREHDTGLGLSGMEGGPASPRSPSSPSSPRVQDHDEKEPEMPVKETEDLSQPNPFNDPGSEVVTPIDEPVVETAKALRYSQASMSPPASPALGHERKTSNISQITDPRSRSTTNVAETSPPDGARRASETSAKRGGPLAALMRRSAPPGRGSGEKTRGEALEPAFSNTSRESMRGQVPPAHLRERTSIASGRSGTPTRTMSKFREDLPESVTGPARSRQSSPVEPPLPPLSSRQREKMPEGGLQGDTGGKREGDVRNDSMGSTTAPSAAVLSQSLASVDSEGSWLSGKPAKRSSQQMTPQMLAQKSEFQGSYENLGVTDEEYFRRQATGQPRSGLSGIRAALGKNNKEEQATSGQDEEETQERIVEGSVDRQPTIIDRETTKSSEGLLSQFKEGEAESKRASPTSATETEETSSPMDEDSPTKPVLGHARSVSRGSARLLEIPSRRASGIPPKAEEEGPSSSRGEGG